MASYPIFFAYKDVVECGEFNALITARGRALLTFEDGKWWLYGVEPGGMAANGNEPKAAFREFSVAFGNIMRDLASETDCPKNFERGARQFFDSIDKTDEKAWKEARKKIKAGKLDAPPELKTIKKITDDYSVSLSIIVVKEADIKKGSIVQKERQFAAAA